jgi:hypothetical protein
LGSIPAWFWSCVSSSPGLHTFWKSIYHRKSLLLFSPAQVLHNHERPKMVKTEVSRLRIDEFLYLFLMQMSLAREHTKTAREEDYSNKIHAYNHYVMHRSSISLLIISFGQLEGNLRLSHFL